jgi:hypothetical protein
MINGVMPTTGTLWVENQDAAKTGDNAGYKPADCVWNVAWNELHAQGNGAENDASRVNACAATLVNDYNDGVAQGKIQGGHRIDNANVVTTDQLTAMAGEANAAVAPASPSKGGGGGHAVAN